MGSQVSVRPELHNVGRFERLMLTITSGAHGTRRSTCVIVTGHCRSGVHYTTANIHLRHQLLLRRNMATPGQCLTKCPRYCPPSQPYIRFLHTSWIPYRIPHWCCSTRSCLHLQADLDLDVPHQCHISVHAARKPPSWRGRVNLKKSPSSVFRTLPGTMWCELPHLRPGP